MAEHSPIRKRAGGSGSAGRGTGGGSGALALEIPDKLYFRIGEVAKLCGVPAYVLRFWESEFPQLKPNKGGTGQRLYRRRDVEMALRIKTLLYEEGYTISGARQAFKAELRAGREPQAGADGGGESIDASHLKALHKELRELHALLLKAPAPRPAVQAIRAARSAAPAAEKRVETAAPAKSSLKPQLLPSPGPSSLFLEGLFDDPPTRE